MSRPWRIEYDGALHHLLSPGNERNDIFIDDKDRSGLKNQQIGELFGLSYSGVSHAVKSIKSKFAKKRRLHTKFDRLNSLFKL